MKKSRRMRWVRTPERRQKQSAWIILRWILETEWGSVGWIDLAQNRNQWKALVNMLMYLQVP
jgi:hypothetical protein